MEQDVVLRMIRDYKACQAKAVQLEGELEILESQAEHAKAVEMAESALHGQNLDGMPHAQGAGDPTGSLVARFLDGYQPRYLRDLDDDIRGRKAALREMRVVCRTVDAWMACLNDRERFILSEHVIKGNFWGEVLRLYEQQWGIITKEALKKAQKRALERIYEIAR